MTTQQLSDHWAAPIALIRRWARLKLVPASKTGGVWTIGPHVRPPYRTGPMMVRLFELREVHRAVAER